MRRRAVLAGVGTILLSGCFDISDRPDLLYNINTEQEVFVTTTIQRATDGETIFSDTKTMRPNQTYRYGNPIQEEGVVEIEVAVEDGPTNSYEWDAPADESYGLSIWISEDEIEFGEIVS